MTRERIIELAKQHGAVTEVLAMGRSDGVLFTPLELETFFHAAQRMEREGIADDLEHGFVDDEGHHIQYAEAIRNRSAS